jgi:hypothetical protein
VLQCHLISRRALLCMKAPNFCLFLLLIRVVLGLRWVCSTDGMILKGKTEVLEEKPVPWPLFQPEMSHGLAQGGPQASDWTAWAKARPFTGSVSIMYKRFILYVTASAVVFCLKANQQMLCKERMVACCEYYWSTEMPCVVWAECSFECSTWQYIQ